MKTYQPFEQEGHDLTGHASADLKEGKTLQEFAASIPGCNPDRFDPVAVKVFVYEKGMIVTLYALDRSAQEKSSADDNKLPVKKFKIEMDPLIFWEYFRHADFVLGNGAYDMADMVVINK